MLTHRHPYQSYTGSIYSQRHWSEHYKLTKCYSERVFRNSGSTYLRFFYRWGVLYFCYRCVVCILRKNSSSKSSIKHQIKLPITRLGTVLSAHCDGYFQTNEIFIDIEHDVLIKSDKWLLGRPRIFSTKISNKKQIKIF